MAHIVKWPEEQPRLFLLRRTQSRVRTVPAAAVHNCSYRRGYCYRIHISFIDRNILITASRNTDKANEVVFESGLLMKPLLAGMNR
ncbi:hypothetical protein PO124_14615 [Bacillus licheniformis]|nr:hypothetical protein [Bacillus licheniformis]